MSTATRARPTTARRVGAREHAPEPDATQAPPRCELTPNVPDSALGLSERAAPRSGAEPISLASAKEAERRGLAAEAVEQNIGVDPCAIAVCDPPAAWFEKVVGSWSPQAL